MKKVFTKLDWQWEHKNVLINAGDKWMMAFMTLEGSFEPTVMSFGLTNSLAIFQTMMNKILWSLINTEEMASFIENAIVETEEEEGHDRVVEEMVKRLAENDLYIKLEKYKWKVREVGFLGIVIEPKRI